MFVSLRPFCALGLLHDLADERQTCVDVPVNVLLPSLRAGMDERKKLADANIVRQQSLLEAGLEAPADMGEKVRIRILLWLEVGCKYDPSYIGSLDITSALLLAVADNDCYGRNIIFQPAGRLITRPEKRQTNENCILADVN